MKSYSIINECKKTSVIEVLPKLFLNTQIFSIPEIQENKLPLMKFFFAKLTNTQYKYFSKKPFLSGGIILYLKLLLTFKTL